MGEILLLQEVASLDNLEPKKQFVSWFQTTESLDDEKRWSQAGVWCGLQLLAGVERAL